jgi:hypothetical protein
MSLLYLVANLPFDNLRDRQNKGGRLYFEEM